MNFNDFRLSYKAQTTLNCEIEIMIVVSLVLGPLCLCIYDKQTLERERKQ